jgi:hypothetical protein
VAICADHLALRNLVEQALSVSIAQVLSVSIAQVLSNRESFGPDVVELEDNRFGLATVDTRMHGEVLDQVSDALGRERMLSAERVAMYRERLAA